MYCLTIVFVRAVTGLATGFLFGHPVRSNRPRKKISGPPRWFFNNRYRTDGHLRDGASGVPVACQWRASGVPVACQWRARGASAMTEPTKHGRFPDRSYVLFGINICTWSDALVLIIQPSLYMRQAQLFQLGHV